MLREERGEERGGEEREEVVCASVNSFPGPYIYIYRHMIVYKYFSELLDMCWSCRKFLLLPRKDINQYVVGRYVDPPLRES